MEDPDKRTAAIINSTRRLETRLSGLGILGFGYGQTPSPHKAVRRAEERFLLDYAVVAAGIHALKDRNKVAHGSEENQAGGEASDDERSSESVETILGRAPQVVEQLWALDREIEIGASKEEERRQQREAEERKRLKEAEREELRASCSLFEAIARTGTGYPPLEAVIARIPSILDLSRRTILDQGGDPSGAVNACKQLKHDYECSLYLWESEYSRARRELEQAESSLREARRTMMQACRFNPALNEIGVGFWIGVAAIPVSCVAMDPDPRHPGGVWLLALLLGSIVGLAAWGVCYLVNRSQFQSMQANAESATDIFGKEEAARRASDRRHDLLRYRPRSTYLGS